MWQSRNIRFFASTMAKPVITSWKVINLEHLTLVRGIHRRFNFYKSVRQSLKWFHEEHDHIENQATSLPQSETIEMPCAWVTEAYTPSNIDTLLASLKSLGWDLPRSKTGLRENLGDWIRERRRYGTGGAWINGGVVVRPGTNPGSLDPDVRTVSLPPGVSYGRLSISHVLHSLTLVTMQFVFDDSLAKSFNPIFDLKYHTKVKYGPGPFGGDKQARFIEVSHQKAEAVENHFRDIHTNLYRWFATNLPGYYSQFYPSSLPTIDLLTSLKNQPPRSTNRQQSRHLEILFGQTPETWKCKKPKYLDLRLGRRNLQNTAILFGDFHQLASDLESYGGKNRDALTNKFNLYVKNNTVSLTILSLLTHFEQQLSDIRDKSLLHFSNTTSAINKLKFVKDRFSLLSADIRTISEDALILLDRGGLIFSDALDFSPPPELKKYSPDLIYTLNQQIKRNSKRLLSLEARVNDTITTTSNLLSAIANLQIQHSVFILTLVTLILTLYSIFKGDIVISELMQKLGQLFVTTIPAVFRNIISL